MNYFAYVLLSKWVIFFWNMYLLFRQRKVCKTGGMIYSQLNPMINQKEMEQMRDYRLEHISFDFLYYVCSTITATFFLWLNGLCKFWMVTESLMEILGLSKEHDQLTQAFLLIMVYVLISRLLELPWKLYRTFQIEIKCHKQSKLTVKSFIGNYAMEILSDIAEYLLFTFILCYFFVFMLLLIKLFFDADLVDVFPIICSSALITYSAHWIYRLNIHKIIPNDKLTPLSYEQRASEGESKAGTIWINNMAEALEYRQLCHSIHNHTIKALCIKYIGRVVILILGSAWILSGESTILAQFGFVTEKPLIIKIFIVFLDIFWPVFEVGYVIMNLVCKNYEYKADAYAAALQTPDDLKMALIELCKINREFPEDDWLYSFFKRNRPSLKDRLEAIEESKDKFS